MKQLNDEDIANMIGEEVNSSPIDKKGQESIRKSLHLSTLIPKQQPQPAHAVIDFHNHTEEEAWSMLMELINSSATSATVITGASGILRPKFQQWVKESIISDKIISCTTLNNGSFEIKLKKKK
ncbi:MAG: Smr/MutS family protein [Alphaproteobacteria bacterium]|nr:Smr/MutS family protein [Alphaproteobacteria bacterium]